MQRPVVYTTGTFDLLHKGHVRMLGNAKALGVTLIVGVSTDELVESYKGVKPAWDFEERLEIVKALAVVDLAIPQTSLDKLRAWERIQFDVWVVGDDWFDSEDFRSYRLRFSELGVDSVFLPYTHGVSSTLRRQVLTPDPAAPEPDADP
jgi:glycerol-3-phosphate cytidylyltransferase